MERELIKKYIGRLVNVKSGGASFNGSELQKAKWKQSRWGYKSLSSRDRHLIKLANMRAAKKRKHDEAVAAGWRPELKRVRAYRFEIGIRNKATSETCFVDLKSARQAHKIAGLILKYL